MTTVPPSAWMNFVLSSRRRTSCRCVPVVVSTHSACTRGRSSAACAARSAPERARPARTGASPCWAGGSLSSIAASTSTLPNSRSTVVAATWVRISSFSIISREIVSNPSSSRTRVLDVEREHPDEREQDRHDGERARTDPAYSGRSSRIRIVRHIGHHAEHRLQSRLCASYRLHEMSLRRAAVGSCGTPVVRLEPLLALRPSVCYGRPIRPRGDQARGAVDPARHCRQGGRDRTAEYSARAFRDRGGARRVRQDDPSRALGRG